MKSKMIKNIDRILHSVNNDIIKADKKMDKIYEKIDNNNLNLVFQDLLERNDEDINSRVYISLWNVIFLDRNKHEKIKMIYSFLSDIEKEKVLKMFNHVLKNYKRMEDEGFFDELEESPYIIVKSLNLIIF